EPFAATLFGRQARDVLSGEQYASGIGRDRAGGDAEERRLAHAVRADDAERLAFIERKVDAIGDDDRAEALADVFESEDGGHGRSVHSSCPALCRASTPLGSAMKTRMAGTSPAMTALDSTQRLQLAADRDRRRRLVFGDHQIEFAI